jgi:hypothetical protein
MMENQGHTINIQGRLIRLAVLSAHTYEFLSDPEAAVEVVRNSDQRADLFTFMQKLPDTSPRYSYHMEWDNLAVLHVSTFDHWWTKQINDKTRNMARRAGKNGVVIREVALDDTFIQGIWSIYNECEIRQGKRYPHYGKDLATVREMTATFLDRSTFMGAYLDGCLIGFARLHCDATRTQAGLSSLLSLIQHRDKAPTNALVAEAVRFCATRGIPYLVYSRYSDGNKKQDSLMDFKSHSGFKRVDLPRYFVPLTPVGRIALAMGLHRNLTTLIPDPILSQLRAFRRAWYSRRAQPASESRFAAN